MQGLNSNLLNSVPGLRHGFLAKKNDALESEIAATVSTVKQVHGDIFVWVSHFQKREVEGDALATTTKNLPVGVYSADCAPILLVATDSQQHPLAVAAIHGGWRGTAQKIAAKGLTEFSRGTLPLGAKRYFAVIGPCISFASFEVGEDVVQHFPGAETKGLAKFLRVEAGRRKFLFDLPGENEAQLKSAGQELGLNLEIERLPICTLLSPDLPSFRRDRENAGRILSYISF